MGCNPLFVNSYRYIDFCISHGFDIFVMGVPDNPCIVLGRINVRVYSDYCSECGSILEHTEQLFHTFHYSDVFFRWGILSAQPITFSCVNNGMVITSHTSRILDQRACCGIFELVFGLVFPITSFLFSHFPVPWTTFHEETFNYLDVRFPISFDRTMVSEFICDNCEVKYSGI